MTWPFFANTVAWSTISGDVLLLPQQKLPPCTHTIAALFVDPARRVPSGFMAVSPFAAESAGVGGGLYSDRSDDDRRAAAEALRCGEPGELVHDTRAPLDAKRFLGNVVDAVRLHDLRSRATPAPRPPPCATTADPVAARDGR